MTAKALIASLSSTVLEERERELFLKYPPTGFILFARNCQNPEALRNLTRSLKNLFPERWVPVLIDQEGGRVQRLKPPFWRQYPPMRKLGELLKAVDRQSTQFNELVNAWAGLIARELHSCGIDVNCAPVLDLTGPQSIDAIGDRSPSPDPELTGYVGLQFARSMLEHGVVPVMKHLPGHGRAMCDSHFSLPTIDNGINVLREQDFHPFKFCREIPMAMTAHILLTAIDPDHPATQSRKVIHDIIRNEIGFKGILFSDDISMEALSGSVVERTMAALEAGCDLVLHCNGKFKETQSLLSSVPQLPVSTMEKLQSLKPVLNKGRVVETEQALALLEPYLEQKPEVGHG